MTEVSQAPSIKRISAATSTPPNWTPRSTWRVALLTTLPLILVDVVTVLLCILCSWGLMSLLGLSDFRIKELFIEFPVLVILSFFAFGLYPAIAMNVIVELKRGVLATSLAFAVFALGLRGYGWFNDATLLTCMAWLLSLIALPTMRIIARRYLSKRSWWGYQALLIGGRRSLAEILSDPLNLSLQGLRPVPFVMDFSAEDWKTVSDVNPHWLVICTNQPWDRLLSQPDAARFRNVLVMVPSMLHVFGQNWIEAVTVGSNSGFYVRNRLSFTRYAFAKRALDLGLSLLILPLVLILGIVVALIVWSTSKGPVFFGHRRIGKDGKWFKAWKFRTMRANADELLETYLAEHPELREEWERTHKLKEDPRVTPVGRFLRRSSLDELPQLWSVISGTMSLVGPRPIVQAEIEKYGPVYDLYKTVQPGVTGLWQVSGRNNTTYPERVAFDSTYVRNWSIWFDLYILARTAVTVLRREGAC